MFTCSYNCNGTPAQEWIITKYNTKVQLAGTNFCLDAGSGEFKSNLTNFYDSAGTNKFLLELLPTGLG